MHSRHSRPPAPKRRLCRVHLKTEMRLEVGSVSSEIDRHLRFMDPRRMKRPKITWTTEDAFEHFLAVGFDASTVDVGVGLIIGCRHFRFHS